MVSLIKCSLAEDPKDNKKQEEGSQEPASASFEGASPAEGEADGPAASAPAFSTLTVGACVRIIGLKKHPDLNGLLGMLMDEKEDARWEVRLDGGHGHKLFKARNLESLPEAVADLAAATADGDPQAIKAAREAAKKEGISEKEVAQIYALYSSPDDEENVD